MGLTVYFYKNFSKRDNSTKVPDNTVTKVTYTCNLKDGTSVLEPVLKLYLSSPDSEPVTNQLNYAWIDKFKRYYFVRDWRYEMGVWYAYLSVDVLASYKTEIGLTSKFIERCTSTYNLDLADTFYPTEYDASVEYITQNSPFKQATHGCFIIGIIGEPQTNVPSVGGVNYYLFTYAEMREFINYMMSNTMTSIIEDSAAGLTDAVVRATVNPLDYIESCYWYPFTIDGVTGATPVQPQVGFWNNLSPLASGCSPLGSGTIYGLVKSPSSTGWSNSFTITNHPQLARGNYLNAEPYSNYIFHLDPWGDVPIRGSELDSSTVSYDVMVDLLSGVGILELYIGTRLYTRQTAQLGVSMPIAQIINKLESLDSLTGVAKGAITGAASSSVSLKTALGNFFSFKTWKHAEGVKQLKNLGKDIVSGIANYSSDVTTTGAPGTLSAFVGTLITMGTGIPDLNTQGPYVKITRFSLVGEDLAEFGRPLLSVQTINTLSGFIQCADGDISLKCTSTEKDRVAGYLTGGFFYE